MRQPISIHNAALVSCCLVATGLFLTTPHSAQAQAQGGFGSVTGQVYCSDTQKPARFAMVSLVPAVTGTQDGGGGRRSFGTAGASTAADGTFTMKEVPAGVYDVQVMMPGYIQPVRQLNLFADADPAARQMFLNMLTQVTVQAGQSASANVTAYRGADLLGSVYYDDGTPAAGINVIAMVSIAAAGAGTDTALTTAGASLRAAGSNAQTDDRGRFHLSGLADGAYTVQAMPRSGGMFPVYLGNTLDRTRATLVTLRAGEERSGLDLLLDITNLHHVRGVLTSPESHAIPNAIVTLTLENASSQLSATTGTDGSFSFAGVPDGKFTAAVNGAYDPDSHVVYKSATAQITVTGSDISDVVLTPTQ